MMYIGYPLLVEEALRLLKLSNTYAENYYDTQKINQYLKGQDSRLQFVYMDKGSCCLGLPLGHFDMRVDEAVVRILNLKKAFFRELEVLEVDTSVVEITHIEQESVLEKNPEPYLLYV